MVLTNRTCAAINTADTQTNDPFFDGHWDAHKIGWLIAGVCAVVSVVISAFTFYMHAVNYYKPKQQRQILRILLMPPVYAILSFFSYRYYKNYTYWSFGTVAYESLVLAAFLLLLLQFIGESNEEQRAVLREKEKHKIPIPFCCIRYRPSKPYFLHALKWSVLQYSFIRPAISVAGIVTDYFGVLCPTGYSIYFAEVYLDAIDFVSISIALYGLIVFGALCRKQMNGQQPLAKFLSIKGIVMITFYQGFVFDVLQDYDVIKATAYWTATNVSDGLQALCTCVEMVIFSAIFVWAFSWKQYKAQRPVGAKRTSFWRATLNSFNYSDFFVEAWLGIVFVWDFIRRKEGTRSSQGGMNIESAFNGDGDFEKSNNLNRASDNAYYASSPASETANLPTPYGNHTAVPNTAFGRAEQQYANGGYAPTQNGYGQQGYQMEERSNGYDQTQQQQQQYSRNNSYNQQHYANDGYSQQNQYPPQPQQQNQFAGYSTEDREYYEHQQNLQQEQQQQQRHYGGGYSSNQGGYAQ